MREKLPSLAAAFLLLSVPTLAGASPTATQPQRKPIQLSAKSFSFGPQFAGAVASATVATLTNTAPTRTATLVFHQLAPAYLYSGFAGSVDVLENGDIEYDLAGAGSGAQIFEVTHESTPRIVWNLSHPGTSHYRSLRLPSLYPGVQW
jgi:hypothetical protein